MKSHAVDDDKTTSTLSCEIQKRVDKKKKKEDDERLRFWIVFNAHRPQSEVGWSGQYVDSQIHTGKKTEKKKIKKRKTHAYVVWDTDHRKEREKLHRTRLVETNIFTRGQKTSICLTSI